MGWELNRQPEETSATWCPNRLVVRGSDKEAVQLVSAVPHHAYLHASPPGVRLYLASLQSACRRRPASSDRPFCLPPAAHPASPFMRLTSGDASRHDSLSEWRPAIAAGWDGRPLDGSDAGKVFIFHIFSRWRQRVSAWCTQVVSSPPIFHWQRNTGSTLTHNDTACSCVCVPGGWRTDWFYES